MQRLNKEIEDTALAIFEYNQKNKLGLIEATNAVRPKNLEGSISIIGEKGSVIVGGFTGDRLIEWTIKKNSNISKLLNKKKNSKINGHIKFYDYVIRNINKKNNFLDVSEGLKSIKIINAIYKSSMKSSSIDIEGIKDSFLGSNKRVKI